MDVMMMKKTNVEKNVEYYKSNGVKLTGMHGDNYCSSKAGACSSCKVVYKFDICHEALQF